MGLTATAFATAEKFLELTREPAPGCVIVDVQLPELSGLELQKRLTAEGRGVPIVFITAYGDDQTRDLALRDGAIAFLQKPFEERLLLDAVVRAMAS